VNDPASLPPTRRRARIGFAFATLAAGLIDVVVNPASINPDGVAYIEVGRAILAGHREGIVGYWSPLYATSVPRPKC
jgi:hypothetical protein